MNTDDPRLTAYALGELDPPERAEIEALLEANPDAAREVAEMKATAALVRAQLATEEAPPLALAQKQEILSEAAAPRRALPAASASITPWRRMWVPLAIAACAALMAGYGAMYFNTPKQPEAMQASQTALAPTGGERVEKQDAAFYATEPPAAAPEAAKAPVAVLRSFATPMPLAASQPTTGLAVPMPLPTVVDASASPAARKLEQETELARYDRFSNAAGDKSKNALGIEKQLQAPGSDTHLFGNGREGVTLKSDRLATAEMNQAAKAEKPVALAGAPTLDGALKKSDPSVIEKAAEADRKMIVRNAPSAVTASSSAAKDQQRPEPVSKLKLGDGIDFANRKTLPAELKPESAPLPSAPAPFAPAPVDEARRSRGKPQEEASADAPAPLATASLGSGTGAARHGIATAMAGRTADNGSAAAPAGAVAQPLRPTAAPRGNGLAAAPDGGYLKKWDNPVRRFGGEVTGPQAGKDRRMELAEGAKRAAGSLVDAGQSAQVTKALENDSVQPQKGVAAKENRAALGFITVDQDLYQRELSNTEAYDAVTDNAFLTARDHRFSTFSIDVDTATYANVRRFLTSGQRPPKGAVRIEELVNYFHYDYPEPKAGEPLSVNMEVAACPWTPVHRLLRIGLKARELDSERRAHANLVFLIDVSGSMDQPNKLPLVKESLRLLVDKLGPQDTVAIAVYAGASGTVLEPTNDKEKIRAALDRLSAGGSTNGAAGIRLAYDLAKVRFDKANTNRVILATDGDFNVGVTNQSDLTDLITEKAKSGVFLTVLGFGYGNLKDSTMEKLADKGNGNYGYIDSIAEGRKVLVEQMAGTLYTVAKDVKLQLDFNPAQVEAYRLIGYENRMLATQDFNDDTKDAGEVGAGHTVTALYEIVPAGHPVPGATDLTGIDPSKYQPALPGAGATPTLALGEEKAKALAAKNSAELAADAKPSTDEMLTVKLRWKAPDGDVSTKREFPLTDTGVSWEKSSRDFRWAASVASFGMLLRDSPHKGQATWATTRELALQGQGKDADAHRIEFLDLIGKAEAATK